jgi:hypothetical protein
MNYIKLPYRNKHKLILFYKILNGLTPAYLYELVQPYLPRQSRYNIRNENNTFQCLFRLFSGVSHSNSWHSFCLEELHWRPVIIRSVSICTLSNKSDSFLVQLSHTTSPYYETDNHCHLGITFQSLATWKKHIDDIYKKAFSPFNLLSFHIFPYLFTIQLTFLPYFSSHFTIFFCIFQIVSLFNMVFFHICHVNLQFNLVCFCIFHIISQFNLFFFLICNISQQPENCENRNDPDLVQAFLKKWWVESEMWNDMENMEEK